MVPPNIEDGYFVDDKHRILYVPILKAASRSVQVSIKPCHRQVNHDVAVDISKDYFTVVIVRHPWDRIVSALWGPLRSFTPFEDRVKEHILDKEPVYINSHVRPQWFTLRGLDLDYIVCVDNMEEDWADLIGFYPHIQPIPHLHKGVARPVGWQAEYDWSKLLPLYERDFELCLDWER